MCGCDKQTKHCVKSVKNCSNSLVQKWSIEVWQISGNLKKSYSKKWFNGVYDQFGQFSFIKWVVNLFLRLFCRTCSPSNCNIFKPWIMCVDSTLLSNDGWHFQKGTKIITLEEDGHTLTWCCCCCCCYTVVWVSAGKELRKNLRMIAQFKAYDGIRNCLA